MSLVFVVHPFHVLLQSKLASKSGSTQTAFKWLLLRMLKNVTLEIPRRLTLPLTVVADVMSIRRMNFLNV